MRLIASFLLAIFLITQSGCTALVSGMVVTATAAATAITMQDKSLGNIIDDTTIVIRINKGLLKHGLFSSIKVKVSEGRVLLIGNVDNHEKQLTAEKIAWQQKEIKEVINEIRVTPIKMASMLDVTVDGMITAEISTRLLGKRNIKSINYSVNTVDRVVYLMGIAQNKAELKAVIAIARKVKGVKQVVSYVRYRHSKLRH
ncbi:BON domain-containing protein [Wolbachia endosymbiont of Drosophila mauritiana]|uniref:BON domain-containing protein n=1 Tax=unclassified Wolbachia TaxID=2640676 RepID=UPI00107E7E76|nr:MULTISPECIES: BON domain-containing protein [unclassified Wolbachia]QCB62898.1 BON domain-containing protein [Wolbachia endosymbiont of Drosophila mauritiana]QCB63943.1 BON domain-containing protein [Wolbachia endosymbiont of Drosophila mauritiana]QWE33794.1 Putative lipoprotein, OsmY-like [Wolbachia endosymbiont of Drosophila simulans]TGB06238.1 BON domain-containing protein [Wolbachia endosymbiont of Drosophila mauritiana]